MKGAREYCELIRWAGDLKIIETVNSGRDWYKYKNILMSLGRHARGKTFNMYVVGDDFKSEDVQCHSIKCDNLHVYGEVSGLSGWTETYGWLHKGKWQSFFEDLIVEIKEAKKERLMLKDSLEKQTTELEKQDLCKKIKQFNELF